MKLNRLDWIKIALRAVKYAGGAIGVTTAFIEGYPIVAPISLILAGVANETLDFIKEKQYKK